MKRTKQSDTQPRRSSEEFEHRRRPLATDEAVPAMSGLVGQRVVLNDWPSATSDAGHTALRTAKPATPRSPPLDGGVSRTKERAQEQVKERRPTQDRWLRKWRDSRAALKVHLCSGYSRVGQLVGWDRYTVTIKVGDGVAQIQKRAITSIMPARG